MKANIGTNLGGNTIEIKWQCSKPNGGQHPVKHDSVIISSK